MGLPASASDSAISIINALESQDKFPYLFVNKRTGTHYKCIKTTWSKIRDLAGLPKVRLHDLRHQFASLMASNGRSLYEIQAILGHAHPQTTMRYAHLQNDTLREAVNSISDRLVIPETPPENPTPTDPVALSPVPSGKS